jgi:hypothetical protein
MMVMDEWKIRYRPRQGRRASLTAPNAIAGYCRQNRLSLTPSAAWFSFNTSPETSKAAIKWRPMFDEELFQ